MQFASTTCLQANKKLATHRSQVARCVARPLASTSSSRDEVTGGFAAAAHREPIAGSISSRLSFQLSRLLNVLLQPEPLHRSSFSSSSMLLCERVALPACVVSSLQVWHILRILALLASASIIVALGRVSASHTAVHMPPARWFSRGALGWPLCSHPLHRKRHWVRGKTSQLDLSCLPSLTRAVAAAKRQCSYRLCCTFLGRMSRSYLSRFAAASAGLVSSLTVAYWYPYISFGMREREMLMYYLL